MTMTKLNTILSNSHCTMSILIMGTTKFIGHIRLACIFILIMMRLTILRMSSPSTKYLRSKNFKIDLPNNSILMPTMSNKHSKHKTTFNNKINNNINNKINSKLSKSISNSISKKINKNISNKLNKRGRELSLHSQ